MQAVTTIAARYAKSEKSTQGEDNQVNKSSRNFLNIISHNKNINETNINETNINELLKGGLIII